MHCNPEAAESWQSQGPQRRICALCRHNQERGVPHLSRPLRNVEASKTPQQADPIVLPISTLSSRAEKDRPLAEDLVKSRNPASADTPRGDRREFSPQTSSGQVRRENASPAPREIPAASGSFDSVNGLASESIPCTQDDNIEKRSATNDGWPILTSRSSAGPL